MNPVYSVVIPCYNEEASIAETHRRLSLVMAGMGEAYELVYVNDGSRDQTPALLDGLADGDSHVRVLHFAANRGHQAAVSAGLAPRRPPSSQTVRRVARSVLPSRFASHSTSSSLSPSGKSSHSMGTALLPT